MATRKTRKRKKQKKIYSEKSFFNKFFYYWYLFIKDTIYYMNHEKPFSEFGVSLLTGKQGSGKTLATVEYLERMKKKYPDCIIVTNFGYKREDYPLNSWEDFLNIRNGEKGVIFAIDELQNEFASTDWKNVPEGLLAEITQQRKQKMKIIATSQVFTRVLKSIREQTYEVIECRTFLGRWTFLKCFEPEEYEALIQDPTKRRKLKRKWRKNFVNDNKLRELYDSYAKIEKIKKTDYIPQNERLVNFPER